MLVAPSWENVLVTRRGLKRNLMLPTATRKRRGYRRTNRRKETSGPRKDLELPALGLLVN
jgi:hypothetical protein